MKNLNKNLLQEVIGKEYKILKITEHSIKVIHEEAFNSVEWCEHKVANMCKEWAFDNFYLSIIVFKINDNLYKCEIADIRDSLGEWITKHSFKISTEHEAIFKATSYVMEQLKQKD